jgi:uncharacterized membrane protein YphA (DoxX/SURF4 family)
MLRSERPALSLTAIIRITAIAWLAGKLVCYKLWLSERLFPLVPVADGVQYPEWLHMGLYGLSLTLLGALVVLPRNRFIAFTIIVCELATCLADQNRWQPWEYQYLFTLVILLTNWRKEEHAFKALAFVFAAIYIYSGLNKFTPGFLASEWAALILRDFLHLPAYMINKRPVYYSGYLLSILETAAGIGLLFYRTQRRAAIVLVAMHLFILVVFGWLGLKRNVSIWPWNVLMIAYLYLFFIKNIVSALDIPTLLSKRNIVMGISWSVLPALCFFGLWDNYFSANLYSGRQPYMLICISSTERTPELLPYMERSNSNICPGQQMINVNKWAYKELNAPPCPQYRVFRKIKASFLQKFPGTASRFIAYPHATWRGHKPQEIEIGL